MALGRRVRLMPPRYVKSYVKRNKNDMANLGFRSAPPRPPSLDDENAIRRPDA
jgi:hypothetical protein